MITSTLIVCLLMLSYAVLYLYRRRDDAMQDTVTGLPSREFFERYLQQCAARATRHPQYGFAVLLLDIRGFSALRRDLGRFATEEILADFAERVSWCIRPSDLITRFSGDNFAIVLDDVRRVTDATRVAMRVQESMTEAVTLAAQPVSVRVNVGVTVTAPGTRSDPAILIHEAESARSGAVALGRPYVVFDPELDAQSVADLALEDQLMRALDADELRMSYSPLMRSDTRELAGYTALIQWEHPEFGLLSARDFIHLAESSQEILRLGAWAIREACVALIHLDAVTEQRLVMTVNVSETELARGDVASVIEEALVGHPDLMARLRVEVPALVLSHFGPATQTTISRLRSMGVGFHLDHVAATSIPLLRTMQLDAIGVRLRLGGNEANSDDPAALRRLLSTCQAFATEIVIEGVETDEELALITALDPSVLVQGYYVSRPMPLSFAMELAGGAALTLPLPMATTPTGRLGSPTKHEPGAD